MDLAANPAFQAYALCMVVLIANLLMLAVKTSIARSGAKVTLNDEDTGGAKNLVEAEPVEAARVMRAHRNAMENILPFAILGLIYVLLGASALGAWAYFGFFAVGRWVHSFAYIAAKQPWRSASYGVSSLALYGLMVSIVYRVLFVTPG